MKILLQVALVFGIYWVGQGIEAVLPFAFPASVISLLLLLVLLLTGVVRVDHIREKSDFLLGNLGFFFIPVSVSIMNYVDLLWQHARVRDGVRGVYGADLWGHGVGRAPDTAAYGPGREAEMMQELFAQPYFGVLLTIAAYWAGMKIQHKTRLAICNGMLLAVLLVIAVLLVFHIPYESYYQGGALINLFLGPATACMAVTIYSQRRLLAKHWLPVLVGCTVGVVTAMGSILLLCRLFGLDRAMTMSLLPKSVTMPIATVVSQGHGGTTAITVAAVVVTGMLGNLCAPLLVKLFRVKDPIAVGLGIGACSHAMGTAKALELGETEGAMSGLAIGLCGILTTVLALFAGFFVA